MNFANQGFLALIPLVALIALTWLWLLFGRRKKLQAFCDPELRSRFIPPPAWRRLGLQFACLLGALTLAVIALARPRLETGPTLLIRSRHQLVVALDVSRSMLARDVHPDRLERAKAMLHDLLLSAAGDRIALIAFGGDARRVCPLTRDAGFLLTTLDGMDIHSAPGGPTDIERAVLTALDSFDPSATGSRTVLLLSDGEHLADPIDTGLLTVLRNSEAVFLTVGIGTENGTPIPDRYSSCGYLQHEGETVITKLEEDLLRRIARETQGAYLPLADGHVDLGVFYRRHRQPLQPEFYSDRIVRQQSEIFQWFLVPAVILMLTAMSLGRARTAGRIKPTAALLWIGLWSLCNAQNSQPGTPACDDPASAPLASRPARLAIRRHQSGDHAAAAASFEQAAETARPRALRSALLYNAAYAWYRHGDFAKAAQRFDEAFELQPEDDPERRHNLTAAKLGVLIQAQPSDSDQAARQRQRLQKKAAALQSDMIATAPKCEWQATLAGLDQALQQLAAIERRMVVFEEHGQRSFSDLADEIFKRQRAINEDLRAARSKPLPEKLRQYRVLGLDQRQAAELIDPLLSALPATAETRVSLAQAAARAMLTAAAGIEDADRLAGAYALEAESAIQAMWQELADYHALLRENLTRQIGVAAAVREIASQNALRTPQPLIDQQREARALSRLAAERLRDSAGRQPRSEPPDSEIQADSRHLPALIARTAKAQDDVMRLLSEHSLNEALPFLDKAIALLEEIHELLNLKTGAPDDPPEDEGADDDTGGEAPPDSQAPAPPALPGPLRDPDDSIEDALTSEEIELVLESIRRRERDYLNERRRRGIRPPPPGRDW